MPATKKSILGWPDALPAATKFLAGGVGDAVTKKLVSSRPCPKCRGQMIYQPNWLTWLTELFRRTCSSCGYADPHRVKLIRGGLYR
jgi:hypothetical protein